MSLVKNLLTQWETEEKNRTRDQSMKNLPTNKGDGKENQKIISVDIVNKKTFQPGLKTRKEKPRLVEKEKIWSRRNMDDEGLSQNKILCSSSGVKLPIVKLSLQAP